MRGLSEILRVLGAVNVNPVEKTLLVAVRLPARPHVVEKRDGPGRRYHELRYWVRGGGKSGRKDGIYLGQLSPIQRLAVRKAIGDAWPHGKLLNATRHLRQVSAQVRDYRRCRPILSVLAERAGYRLHGYALRRKKMKPSTSQQKMPAAQTERVGANEDPIQILRQGLAALRDFGTVIIGDAVRTAMTRIARSNGEMTDADQRIMRSVLGIMDHQRLVDKSIAILDGK